MRALFRVLAVAGLAVLLLVVPVSSASAVISGSPTVEPSVRGSGDAVVVDVSGNHQVRGGSVQVTVRVFQAGQLVGEVPAVVSGGRYVGAVQLPAVNGHFDVQAHVVNRDPFRLSDPLDPFCRPDPCVASVTAPVMVAVAPVPVAEVRSSRVGDRVRVSFRQGPELDLAGFEVLESRSGRQMHVTGDGRVWAGTFDDPGVELNGWDVKVVDGFWELQQVSSSSARFEVVAVRSSPVGFMRSASVQAEEVPAVPVPSTTAPPVPDSPGSGDGGEGAGGSDDGGSSGSVPNSGSTGPGAGGSGSGAVDPGPLSRRVPSRVVPVKPVPPPSSSRHVPSRQVPSRSGSSTVTTLDTGFDEHLPYGPRTQTSVITEVVGGDELGFEDVWVEVLTPGERFEPFLAAGLVLAVWAAHIGVLLHWSSPRR